MFSFRKKDKEKKKEKKEKKEKDKQKERPPMTQDELNKLEEVKKGLLRRLSDRDRSKKILGKWTDGMLKSESSDSSVSSADRLSPSRESADSGGGKSWSFLKGSGKAPPPAVLPKPKSILKERSNYGPGMPNQGVTDNIDDSTTLVRNTIMNETLPSINIDGTDSVDAKSESDSAQGEDAAVPTTPSEKTFSVDLHLPDLIPPKSGRVRELVLKRQKAGGFGFSLRKGSVLDRSAGNSGGRPVIFAEPGAGEKGLESGLLPGDRLIEVNGENVENCRREDIIEKVRSSPEEVKLKVQPLPEVLELGVRTGADGSKIEVLDNITKGGGTLKRSGSMRYKKTASQVTQTKSEEDVKSEKAWLEADGVWLIHKGGYSGATLLKTDGVASLPEGKVKIKINRGGELLEVDEEDVEKANPPQFDKTEDLSSLRYLNECSVLHTLRQRYGSNLIHSYAGPSVLIVNPMSPLHIYSEKVVHMFKGCKLEDMPPHVYAVAQHAHREMLNTKMDQSIVLMGRSGSGKSVNATHALTYLVMAYGSVNNVLTVDKLNAIRTVLESIGNSRTVLNTNASRFTQLTSLNFDFSGQICSAAIQILMFEKSRVVRRPEGEPNFHIFYEMLAGVDSNLRSELQLGLLTDHNLFMTPLQRPEDRQKALQSWARVSNALEVLGVLASEMKAIYYVLAAIYHLGAAGATKGANNKSQFAKPAPAQKAAALLGIKPEELSRMIFSPSSGSPGSLTRSASMRLTSATERQMAETGMSSIDALEGFVVGLYSDVCNVVVALINRSLTSNYRSLSSINVVDMPGFQNPSSCGKQTGASFEDLCCNYVQERLQLFFHDLTFTLQQDRYSQENVECDFEFMMTSPAAIVSLIDKPATTMIRSSNTDLRNADKKGLLWLLDEVAIFPGANEDSFMERLFTQHADHPVRRDSLLRKGSLGNTFVLNHFQGTSPVQYNASGWLKSCREYPSSKSSITVLQDSSRDNISELFTSLRGPMSSTVTGSIVGMDGSTSLRRVASMRRTFTSGAAGLKRKSICIQIKLQVDSIVEILRRTKCHFIHCLLPQNNAGLCELKMQSPTKSDSQKDILLNIPLVRAQIRGNEILDAVRIFRQGFPDSMQFAEFKHRFGVLVPNVIKTETTTDEIQLINQLLDHMDIDKLNYRVGLSQVFFRAGALTQLEVARDEKITGNIIKFQAYCRGFLGRKKVDKLRVQHTAISCIQKNIRKFMLIQDWQWWRLYVRVKPLLNVHRTEEELKNKDIEIEQMKTKLEKLERERNDYKQHCDKLENRLQELTADLAEESTASTNASEMLEQETAERMRLEKELKDVQTKFSMTKRQNEKLEHEVMQTRLWQVQSFDGETDEDEIDGGVYKERYERLRRESDYAKKQLSHQHEEEIQQEQIMKKHLEKKLHEAIEDTEDIRRQLQSSRKKVQKVNAEMQDIKRHLEEQISRNSELERKQRRFDLELNMAHQDTKEERAHREKLQREKDELLTAKFSLEQQFQKLKMDNELNVEKIERLERELNDLSQTGKDDNELLTLKRAKHELEMKVHEQEEELDDQAGQIQQLEQTKLRLEMNLQKSRQEHLKELEEKEEELEEMRYSTQKKLKQLENQLEEEYSEKRMLMQDKRELERHLQEFGAKQPEKDKDVERRLKRDLKRTRALLKDAETVIQKQKNTENTKTTIRQLRNQLEDAEFSAAAAVKAKKNMELEVEDLQQQLDILLKSKQVTEDRYMSTLREMTEIQSRLEENEEMVEDNLKKFQTTVKQQALDQMTITNQLQQIEQLQKDKDLLQQEVSELTTKVQVVEDSTINKHVATRLEGKVRELQSKLELEEMIKYRFEVQISRIKEQLERALEENNHVLASKHQAEEALKRLQREIKDTREELGDIQKRELETSHKRLELESRVSELEIDFEQSQSDLKLAFKRISGLQAALEETVESDDVSPLSDSDYSDDEDVDLGTFLGNHRPAPIGQMGSCSSSSVRSRTASAGSSASADNVKIQLDSSSSVNA